MRNLLVTGGAGFMGSNFARYILQKYPDYHVVVYDKLTYAGNLDNVADLKDSPRFSFMHGDICDSLWVEQIVQQYEIDTVVNFAGQTHVDRSLRDAESFIQTNQYGPYVLVEVVQKLGLERFLQVSTDEVYGNVLNLRAKETDPLCPRNPYAASKAGAELIILAYHTSYGTPIVITRGSNTFGSYQHIEKVIPLFVTNSLDDQPLPLYGDGLNIREWIYVDDHSEAIDLVLHEGEIGHIYNVASGNEMTNLELTKAILRLLRKPEGLITFVADRPGHDRRYALNTAKIKALGWQPRHTFQEALEKTVQWYVENEWWWRKIKSGEYRDWYERQYGRREIVAP